MFEITKEIGLDAAHRVPKHQSKCRNLHGHRYTVQATIMSEVLKDEGSETGMVMDFGFLKELMIEYIHDPCDHGTIVCVNDVDLAEMLRPRETPLTLVKQYVGKDRQAGFRLEGPFGKTLFVAFVPTAENLARYWFSLLYTPVARHGATLQRIRVWETPSSFADYHR